MKLEFERAAAGAGVSAFVKDALAGRPWPMPASGLEELLARARDFRLLPPQTQQGVWQSGLDHGRRQLATLAFHNPALAWQVHLISLAGRIAAACGRSPAADTVPWMPGGNGLGRGALARRLFALEALPGDAGLLSQCLPGPGKFATLYAVPSWKAVILPLWCGGTIRWSRCERAQLAARDTGPGHGLDGCRWWRMCVPSAAHLELVPPEKGREILTEAMCTYHLGLLSVSEGILQSAAQRGTDYARRRVQGGRALADHPAVELSLGALVATRSVAGDLLDSCMERRDGAGDTIQVLAARRILGPLFCEALSEVLQIHGGAGYLTETGLEGLLRDANQLRLMGGTARDIDLFLAAMATHPR